MEKKDDGKRSDVLQMNDKIKIKENRSSKTKIPLIY